MANYDLTYEGSRVQGILDTGNSLKDAGYIFRGEATPSTVPGTPTERVAYIGGPGTYTNFGGSITVGAGCICVFKYTGSAWSNQVINTGLSDAISSEATTRSEADTALQNAINAINNNIGNGYVYAGVATPSTSPVTGKVFYLAVTAGTYTNFGNAVVTAGLNVLKYNGSAWSVDQVIAIDAEPTQGSANLVKSGGVLNSIIQNGPAFDLSAYNAQGGVLATYADLSAALTALNTLPADFKKGGMSMKFVQTSDNKYVQYRLMKSTWSTVIADWQGVDDVPTAGSNNLVKSNGILDSLIYLISDLVNSGVLKYQDYPITTIANYYINNKGEWKYQGGQKTIYMQVHKGDFVKISHGGNGNYSKYALFGSEPQVNDVPFLFIPNTPSTTSYSYAIITEDCYIASSDSGTGLKIAVIEIGAVSTYKDYLYVKNLTTVEPTPISNAYIDEKGIIRNNFSGYTVNSYQVSVGDKFYIKGKTSGYITVIAFYKSNTFNAANVVNLMYKTDAVTEIEIDDIIQVPRGATYMAITQSNGIPSAQKIVVSTYQRTNTQYSSLFISELENIYNILFSYSETLLTTSDYRNGYYIEDTGTIRGGGTFPGYRLVVYPVQVGKKYRLIGKDTGSISVACSYTDDTLATKVSQFLPHSQNSQFDVDSIIEIIGSSTTLAVCEAIAWGGIKVYELGDETINNLENLQERVSALEEDEFVKKQVVCWGDSLTAGAGSQNTTYVTEVKAVLTAKGFSLPNASYNYVQTIAALLGTDNYQVVNCGVGGESINTIAAREGALPACIEANVTIPALASEYGSISGLKSAFDLTANCAPLLQGHGNSVNPCYIEGIKCTLSYDSTNGYRIKRQSNGDRTVTVVNGTPIIMYGSSAYRNSEIAILWCWTNGGYSSNDELVQKLKMMIQHLNTERYIIVGIHYGNTATLITQENELLKHFGDKFFNWRKYVSSNAMYDFGITPTANDLTDMQEGKIPRSFLTDSVHINSGAYMILGWKLYERMIQLGYIEV